MPGYVFCSSVSFSETGRSRLTRRSLRVVRALSTLMVSLVPAHGQPAFAANPALATYTLSPGWATFGLALPQGAAKAVQVGSLQTQTDVKVRWPDGSIRFAIVSANAGVKGASYA